MNRKKGGKEMVCKYYIELERGAWKADSGHSENMNCL